MGGVISIPRSYMGQTLQEVTVKAALQRMNPDLHFDMGTCLGIWHPYQQFRQNIYCRGNSIGAMDRGTLPEMPVWTIRKDIIEVPWAEVRFGEIVMQQTQQVRGECQKCKHSWQLPMRPHGSIMCPALCENIGLASDPTLFTWADVPTGRVWVWRSERDKIVLVGWRHTFRRLVRACVPGITQAGLETEFRVSMDPKHIDPLEIEEGDEASFMDRSLVVGG